VSVGPTSWRTLASHPSQATHTRCAAYVASKVRASGALFDVDSEARVRERDKHLVQGRDAEARQLAAGHAAHDASAADHPAQCRVVERHARAVGGHPHVGLQVAHARGIGPPERVQRVLRSEPGAAAMRYRKRRRSGTVDRFGHDMNCPSSADVRGCSLPFGHDVHPGFAGP
jgi:hypothetical protein